MEPELDLQQAETDPDESNSVTPVDIAGFVLRAARRHPRLGITIGLVVAVLGLGFAIIMPSSYDAEARILVAPSAAVATALSNPNSRLPNVDVLGGSGELLMQKSNLVWMIQQTDLLTHWKATRPLPMRIKDQAMALVAGTLSDSDRMDALIKMLEQKMVVSRENTFLRIHVSWNNADMAWKLASLARDRFLESRRTQELSVIAAAISILEDEVKRAGEAIDPALEEVVHAIEHAREVEAHPAPEPSSSAQAHKVAVATVVPAAPAAPKKDEKLAEKLSSIRQQVHDVEGPWQRRIADLKLQLTDLRATYGPAHPSVVQQEAKIREASVPPEELGHLRRQEQDLLAQIQSSAIAHDASTAPRPRFDLAPIARPLLPPAHEVRTSRNSDSDRERQEDPVVGAARSKLTSTIDKYNDLNNRLGAARIELITAQAAFQYRYVVVNDPERPRKATKPNRPMLVVVAILAAIVVGLIAGAVRDLLTGRIIEPWQIKPLGVPVLGELRVPRKTKP